jgi:hypothetical protein
MKKNQNKLLFKKIAMLFLMMALLIACNKDDDVPQTLPEATQTGRGIFACYVNGKPYIDIRQPNTINFNAFYQLVNGDYFFNITSTIGNIGDVAIGTVRTIGIGTTEKEIIEGGVYQLLNREPNNAWGLCAIKNSNTTSELLETNVLNNGEMTITKLDIENQIVSGTFWFNVENPFTGETIEIREGRFDTRFGT